MIWLGTGILLGLLWWSAGVSGFVYWWTSQWDLKREDLAAGLFIGACLGPLAWIAGAWIHGDRKKIFMEKRG